MFKRHWFVAVLMAMLLSVASGWLRSWSIWSGRNNSDIAGDLLLSPEFQTKCYLLLGPTARCVQAQPILTGFDWKMTGLEGREVTAVDVYHGGWPR